MPHKKACPLQMEWKLFIISSQFLVAILECLPGREILIIFFFLHCKFQARRVFLGKQTIHFISLPLAPYS